MLEYFTYKKVKKNRAEKAEKERAKSPRATPSPSTPTVISKPDDKALVPVLDQEDQKFLERITSPEGSTPGDDDEGTPPPLPPRVKTPVMNWDSDDESVKSQGKDNKGKGKAKETGNKLSNRFSVITNIGRSVSLRKKPTENSGLKPPAQKNLGVPGREVHREETDISRVLDDLNLSAQNNKVFSLSPDSTEMVRKFNLILKDLINGVPTAYGDLVHLLEDRDTVLAKNYEKLPKSMQKLVTTLPNKLSMTLAPELLAVAAEAQGISHQEASKKGLKGTAQNFLTPKSLQQLVTKPGAVVGLLKGIVNALKTRWPAFMGTNILWSVAIFLLLSVLWYCHKRGRETRLEREAAEKDDPLNGAARVEELPDDPALPAPSQAAHTTPLPTSKRSGKSSPVPATASSSKKR